MAKSKVLARPVQVYSEEHGHVQLPKGSVPPDWALEQITNPKAFEEVEEVTSVNDEIDNDLGTGPFEKRRKEQLLALARQFDVPHDADDTKAEIIKALEANGIEPSTVPDEG